MVSCLCLSGLTRLSFPNTGLHTGRPEQRQGTWTAAAAASHLVPATATRSLALPGGKGSPEAGVLHHSSVLTWPGSPHSSVC